MDIRGELDRLLDIGPAPPAARIEEDMYTKLWLKCSPLVLDKVNDEEAVTLTLGRYRILEPNQMHQCLELGMRYCLNLLVEGGKKAFYGFLKTLQDTNNKESFDLLRDMVIEAECAQAVGADDRKDKEEKEQAVGEDVESSLQASMVYGQIIVESATEITRYLQNLQTLVAHLKKLNVLSRVAMQDVIKLGTNHLVQIMSTRGKTEFTAFLDALGKTGNERLHEILKNKMEDAEAIMEKEGKNIPEARPIGKTKALSLDDILQPRGLIGRKEEILPAELQLTEAALQEIPRIKPPKRPIERIPSRKPQALLSRDLDTDLDIGSLAEVNIKRKEKGVVRWIGFSDSPLKPIVGIELDYAADDATDGTYKGTRVFKCEQNKALFVPLQNCRPDPRFSAEIEEDIVGRVQDVHRSKPRTKAPSADVSAEFIAGARVTVNFGGSLHGIVRWTGRGGKSELPMVGVELDAENQAASDGVFEGKKLFICPPKKALFVPAAVCKVGELTIEDPVGLDKGLAFRQTSQTTTNLGTIGITPDIQRLIPAVGHKVPEVEVTELDPAYLGSGLSYGALVKVDIGADILGKFRWYGRCSAISHPLGGVELMNPHPDGTDGSFLGHRLFSSDRGRSVVVCLCKLQVVPSSTPHVSRTPAIQAPLATTPSSGQGKPSLMDSFSTHRSLFIQELRVQDLLHKLQTAGVLDTHQVEQVEQRTDRRDQASYIMDIMAEAEMRSKGKFFNVLKTHQKELFQQLIGMAAMR